MTSVLQDRALTGRLAGVVVLAIGVAACASPQSVSRPQPAAAHAKPPIPAPTTEEVLASLNPLDAGEMGNVRGGFTVNGWTISFAATITAAVTEAGGRFSELSTSIALPAGGPAVVETSETSNASGALTTFATSQALTQDQAGRLFDTIQLELRTPGTSISQQGLTSVIQNTVSDAAIRSKIEATIDVHSFSSRFQTLQNSLNSRALMSRINGFGLSP